MAGSDITDRARGLACKITGIDVDQIEDYGPDEIARIARIAEAALQRERDEALREAAERYCTTCGLGQDADTEGCGGHMGCEQCAAIRGPEPKEESR